jgi:hypothetical protein
MPMPNKLFLGIWAFRHFLMIFQKRKAAAGYGRAGCIPFLLPTDFVNAGMPAGLHPFSPVPVPKKNSDAGTLPVPE